MNVTLSQPDISNLWSPGAAKVDILVTMPIAGNEVGFFIAHKLNATFVLWLLTIFQLTYSNTFSKYTETIMAYFSL